MLKLNIIGCGRAGGTIAHVLTRSESAEINQVLNSTPSSSNEAVQLLGAGEPVSDYSSFQPADIWLISTPDGNIRSSAETLVNLGPPLEGSIVLHLSGRFGPEVLDVAGEAGASIAAVHPVRSMPRLSVDESAFAGTLCVAAGDSPALNTLRDLFTVAGADWREVSGLDRGLYHAALSIVSNVTKGVVWKAQNWLEQAGLDPDAAAQASHSLLSITVEDVFREGAKHSITGPVVRGDTSTVEAHLDALGKVGQHDTDIYRVLARTVLDLANERGDLPDDVLERFDQLFELKRDSS